MKKLLIAVVVLVLIAVIAFLNTRFKKEGVSVEVVKVERRNITKIVTASGKIKPKRSVDVSASTIGKVTKVGVKEGDYVKKGDFLLQIDPTEYETTVNQLKSQIRSAEAQLEVEEASLEKAEYDYNRAKDLFDRGFVSEEELREASIALDIQKSKVRSAREYLLQRQVSLDKAEHDLREVRISAEMSGVVTSLNVEEGENAIMGTLNNPGTVLLTIADLSQMEAEVEVDETEVIFVKPGQKAKVKLDAYPDSVFSGVVTEVGSSAIKKGFSGQEESVDFKVVVSILDSIPGIRPGLSASTEIAVAKADSVLSLPIQCLTVRNASILSGSKRADKKSGSENASKSSGADRGSKESEKEVEGVFVVEDGVARFRKVVVGITGENYFEVRSGLEEGESAVSGPFKALSDLRNNSPVKIKKKASGATKK